MSTYGKDRNMNEYLIFRKWAPGWLIFITLFSMIIPSMVVFFLPMANVSAAAGYYGCEPADIQFAVILFYAGYAGFYSLERRFFSYLATKEYFVIFTFLQIVSTVFCFSISDVYLLYPVRFIQGMLFACTVNLSLTLLFTRFHSEVAREVGFSVMFGLLLIAMPLNNLISADLIDAFDFNTLYLHASFLYIPGFVLLLVTMHTVRLHGRFPLSYLDWQSFVLYSVVLILIGYMLVYGQEHYWLQDPAFRYALAALLLCLSVYLIRQHHIKRPYTDLRVFSFSNFVIGMTILYTMYICRFASGLTNSFFTAVLKLDPRHLSYINLANIAGLVAGVVMACMLILRKWNVRYIWMSGFSLLLVYHARMFFLFATQADEDNYYVPLMIQGLGVGVIMVPAIVYAISSVPASMGASASAIGLTIRYLGFCTSIAVMNYYELYSRGQHYSALQDTLTRTNPLVRRTLAMYAQRLTSHGMQPGAAAKMANKLLINAAQTQTQMRYAMDYYEVMAYILLAMILLIALIPYLNRTVVDLRSRDVAPV